MLIVPSAFALDLTEFNVYASVFGQSKLSNGRIDENENGVFTTFNLDDCKIIILEVDSSLKTIGVYGNGDKFLAYSSAAMMLFDPSTENRASNFGQFFISYLMNLGSPSEKGRVGIIGSGDMFGVSYEDDMFTFLISKKKD